MAHAGPHVGKALLPLSGIHLFQESFPELCTLPSQQLAALESLLCGEVTPTPLFRLQGLLGVAGTRMGSLVLGCDFPALSALCTPLSSTEERAQLSPEVPVTMSCLQGAPDSLSPLRACVKSAPALCLLGEGRNGLCPLHLCASAPSPCQAQRRGCCKVAPLVVVVVGELGKQGGRSEEAIRSPSPVCPLSPLARMRTQAFRSL